MEVKGKSVAKTHADLQAGNAHSMPVKATTSVVKAVAMTAAMAAMVVVKGVGKGLATSHARSRE